jgi:hexosaminidase
MGGSLEIYGQASLRDPLWCLLHARLFSGISVHDVLNANRLTSRLPLQRWTLVCAAAVSFLSGCLSSPPTPVARQVDVIPAPARAAFREGIFTVRAGTAISVPRNQDAARIARYLAGLLEETRGVRLNVVERSDESLPEGSIAFRLDKAQAGANPESYAIDVSPRRIVLSAGDPRGLFYAAVTVWQLSTSGSSAAGGIAVPAQRISDSPRLAWRGLMLDSARHFQTPQFVMQFIDWMALHKLNVLHWHLTDDQGWRLEIKKYPRLTEVGAWRVPAGPAAAADIDPTTGRPRLYGGFYSQDDVRRIVAHAAERNITIVPEIDMPGHATAAIVAYPRLGVMEHPPSAVPADWGIYPNLYNVDDDTFNFLEDVLDEVMALFPGKYLHLGGDEAVKDQWKASPRVQARMRELQVADEKNLQSYFIQRIEKYVNAHGRQVIGWDEILEGGIAQNATVMSWRGLEGAVSAVGAGHDTVLSPWPTLYFDNRQGTGSDEPPGRGKVISLRDVYDFDPMPPGIAANQRQHILGLQANIWTEHIRTEDRLAYMTFPRAAAVAEVGWSASEQHDWNSFLRRLPSQFARYQALGLRYSEDVLHPDGGARKLGSFERHASQDLRTCTDKLVLSLEDDAPVRDKRAIFLIDLMNPCWILPAADLSQAPALQVAVGQVPFNFQLGKDKDAIQLAAPQTPTGELEVHVDTCGGERIAVLSLAPAVGNDAVTELPAVRLPRTPGRHDLCLRFTQRALDPMWALDWVQLQE